MKQAIVLPLFFCCLVQITAAQEGKKYYQPQPQKSEYAEAMKKVAAQYKGTQGVVIHLGCSMTIANPYTTWARYGKGRTAEDMAVLKWAHMEKRDKTDGWWLCRMEEADHRAYTSVGGMTSKGCLTGGNRKMPPLKDILERFDPQMVVIMIGSYDGEADRSVEDYRKYMTQIVEMCLARHAIPLLTTVCPLHDKVELFNGYNKALREIAREKQIPLIDFEKEIMTLRPNDWNGTLQRKNNIHLTAREAGGNCKNEPTRENLSKSGYHLRAYLTVKKMGEVKQKVIDPVFGTTGK